MKKLRVGIVGCGAIGSSLAKAIVKDFKKEACLCALYDLNNAKALGLSKKLSKGYGLKVDALKYLIDKSDLVIESAHAKFSWDIAKSVLSAKKSVMIMSVGGVSRRLKDLTLLAKKNNSKVYIPSGAIAGIDALKAAGISRIKKVTLTTTKAPIAFKGVKYVEGLGLDLQNIKKETVLFSGAACEAVKYFPQNINVAAVLSLAGVGIKQTKVRIIASPFVRKNIHEIRIESVAGNIFTRTENILHPENPKTSYLAVLSAVAVLKQILGVVKIGT